METPKLRALVEIYKDTHENVETYPWHMERRSEKLDENKKKANNSLNGDANIRADLPTTLRPVCKGGNIM